MTPLKPPEPPVDSARPQLTFRPDAAKRGPVPVDLQAPRGTRQLRQCLSLALQCDGGRPTGEQDQTWPWSRTCPAATTRSAPGGLPAKSSTGATAPTPRTDELTLDWDTFGIDTDRGQRLMTLTAPPHAPQIQLCRFPHRGSRQGQPLRPAHWPSRSCHTNRLVSTVSPAVQPS